jgi:hypothetical protein
MVDNPAEAADRQRGQRKLTALIRLGRIRHARDEDRLVLYPSRSFPLPADQPAKNFRFAS